MPAQSPTLSPTLSAMVAGLRGSSSGIPASTLPTRSPPTSAPLVKMPPPRRAKIKISDAPKPSATSGVDDRAVVRARPTRPDQVAESRRSRRAARDRPPAGPVIAPALNAMSRPPARRADRRLRVRTLARTDMCMPMKPAAPTGLRRSRSRSRPSPSRHQTIRKTTMPTIRSSRIGD